MSKEREPGLAWGTQMSGSHLCPSDVYILQGLLSHSTVQHSAACWDPRATMDTSWTESAVPTPGPLSSPFPASPLPCVRKGRVLWEGAPSFEGVGGMKYRVKGNLVSPDSPEERPPEERTSQAEARSLSRGPLSWVGVLSVTKAEASLSCGWRGGSGQWSPLEATSRN